MNIKYVRNIFSFTMIIIYQFSFANTIDSLPFNLSIEDSKYIPDQIPEVQYQSIFESYPNYLVDGYNFPVGYPNADGYYNANPFGHNNHLGEDWNGVNGGDTDLGDPVFVIGNGLVTFAQEVCCGWGNVVRVIHAKQIDGKIEYIESVYAHLLDMDVEVGHLLLKGQKVGSIGNVNGTYPAHLHLEIRDLINMPIGGGYSKNKIGYLNPTTFIKKNRITKNVE